MIASFFDPTAHVAFLVGVGLGAALGAAVGIQIGRWSVFFLMARTRIVVAERQRRYRLRRLQRERQA